MGQHKHNPVAVAAKKGELPPKPKKPSKREREMLLWHEMISIMHKKGLLTPPDVVKIIGKGEFEYEK